MPSDVRMAEFHLVEFAPVIDELAREVHAAWMRARFAEGWKAGPERNDSRREHPGLVPFDELPEIERAYDRHTAQVTLKRLMELGYRISRTVDSDGASDEGLITLQVALKDLSTATPPELVSFWRRRDPALWGRAPELYRRAADRMLHIGEPLLAFDVANEGLKRWKNDVRLTQLIASALLKSGAARRANEILRNLMERVSSDEETLGLLASSYKQLALRSVGLVGRAANLRLASDYYLKAYREFGGIWTGINAATLLLLGDGTQGDALAIATQVRDRCKLDLTSASDPSSQYWLWATIAETWLIQGNTISAAEAYSYAVTLKAEFWGNVCATLRNARLILEALPDVKSHECDRIVRMLTPPPIALFFGLATDPREQRFPSAAEQGVKEAIRRSLDATGAIIGYASAACGSDLLFLEAMLERGGEIRVVLPYNQEEFRRDAVAHASAEWARRFDVILQRATDVIEASNHRIAAGGASLRYGSLLLHGLAKLKSLEIGARLLPFAVWDGADSFSPNGKFTVRHWQEAKLDVTVIRVNDLIDDSPQYQQFPSEGDGRLVAFLFADAVHFSNLNERQVAMFVRHFMGLVGDIARRSTHRPFVTNTWGDGLFFTFDHIRDAGLFALELCEHIDAYQWTEVELPADLTLRIGLHAGPIIYTTDPVTQRPGLYGTHVNQAARIEPAARPGEVYASRAFAAVAAAEGVNDFTCEYVGQIDLAKSFGTFPMFRVQRSIGLDLK